MSTTLTHNEMLNQPQVANLMRWIDSHFLPAATRFDVETGMLIVVCEEVDRSGVVHFVPETIPATLAAARALLGY